MAVVGLFLQSFSLLLVFGVVALRCGFFCDVLFYRKRKRREK